jgi:hypothetical protein
MSHQTVSTQNWTLTSIALTDAVTAFSLGRQAMRRTPETPTFYMVAAGKFVLRLSNQNINTPAELNAR